MELPRPCEGRKWKQQGERRERRESKQGGNSRHVNRMQLLARGAEGKRGKGLGCKQPGGFSYAAGNRKLGGFSSSPSRIGRWTR